MGKNFTLVKTLTAFFKLLVPGGLKNLFVAPVNLVNTNNGTTTVNNQSKYVNDAKHSDASFLFSEGGDQSSVNGQHPVLKNAEQEARDKVRNVNDELASENKSGPKNEQLSWRQRVNDDLAFFNESITNENLRTKAHNNDAMPPIASFSFLHKYIFREVIKAFGLITIPKLAVVKIYNNGNSAYNEIKN